MFHQDFRALVADEPHAVAAQLLKDSGFIVDEVIKLTPDVIGNLHMYDALILRSGEFKDPAFFEKATKLKVICRAGTGYDNIDRDLATKHGVAVMNTPDGNAPAAAELTMAHMLNLARQVTTAHDNMHKGAWTRVPHKNDFQLRGKILGIIGCGRIGSLVARYAQGFNMDVLVFDPYVTDKKIEALGGRRALDLDELLVCADIVTLHADLNNETRRIINAGTLALCKKGVHIINCARGPMIDAAALATALQTGHVAGAALDVIDNEPTKGDPKAWMNNPLLTMPQVYFTPHIGGTTKESLYDVAYAAAEQAINFLKEGRTCNAVNEPFCKQEMSKEMVETTMMRVA